MHNERETVLDQFACSFFSRSLAAGGADDSSPPIPEMLNYFATTPSSLLFANPILLQIIRNIPFTAIQEALQSRELDVDPMLQELNISLEAAEGETVT